MTKPAMKTKYDQQRILELLKLGVPSTRISKELGCCVNWVLILKKRFIAQGAL